MRPVWLVVPEVRLVDEIFTFTFCPSFAFSLSIRNLQPFHGSTEALANPSSLLLLRRRGLLRYDVLGQNHRALLPSHQPLYLVDNVSAQTIITDMHRVTNTITAHLCAFIPLATESLQFTRHLMRSRSLAKMHRLSDTIHSSHTPLFTCP